MNSIITQSITKPVIVRYGHLAEKIVIIDGLPGCGKTLFSPIVAAMGRVELLNYAFEVEYICRLFHLSKIQEDAAISMVRLFTDLKLYNTMMGRETNFRYSDISSVFNSSNPWRYFKRIFQKGDMTVPDRIKREKPILCLTTHNLLGVGDPVFKALENRLLFIEIVRHPLYMIIQQTLNMERLLDTSKELDINFKNDSGQLPWYTCQWEDLFKNSNPVEKAIYSIHHGSKLTEEFKSKHNGLIKGKTLTIPFDSFVLDPWPYLKKIEDLLGSKITRKTKRIIKKQNVPREKISDGIPLAIYKRCGWEAPVAGFTEKDELNKRREFAVNQGASKEALELLDEMSAQYEVQYLKGII